MKLNNQLLCNLSPSFLPKRYYCFFLCLFFISNETAGQVLQLDWAKGMIGNDYAMNWALELDEERGGLYSIGSFSGTIDFDPGPNTHNLTANGTAAAYLQKLDTDGNLLWVIDFNDSTDTRSMALDSSGNVYVVGRFRGTVDFDPGIGVNNLSAPTNSSHVYILKLDASGNFLWAKSFGGTGTCYLSQLTVDPWGNILLTGHFQGMIDFDPGTGFNNQNYAYETIYILKLNASGNFLWVKIIEGNDVNRSNSIVADHSGNIYTTGYFQGMIDFDPGPNVFNASVQSGATSDAFVLKLDASGGFVWAKTIGGLGIGTLALGYTIKVDSRGNVYSGGTFKGPNDFDPGVGTFMQFNQATSGNAYIQKLDSVGNFVWAKTFGGTGGLDQVSAIAFDKFDNVYTVGVFNAIVDFDPSVGVQNLTSNGDRDAFLLKLDADGNFTWATGMGAVNEDISSDIAVDNFGTIYNSGHFEGTVDFNPDTGTTNLISTHRSAFIQKLRQRGIYGQIFQDVNSNCIQENLENSLADRIVVVQPGEHYAMTNSAGFWLIDSLPTGNYTVTVDTSGNWVPSCPIRQSFTINNVDTALLIAPFGLASTTPCPKPLISVHAPFLRPGFSNQLVYVQACNTALGTALIDTGYVIIELDSLLTVQTGTLPYTSLGNNQYRVDVGALYPGDCVPFALRCSLSTNAVLNQSLCMRAVLYPIDSCALDTIPTPSPLGITPCLTNYDGSHLNVKAICQNDTIHFMVTNIGDGAMSCYSQVRLYIDGQFIWMDSVQLAVGVSQTFVFAGDGRTWRMEVDQHSLYPGNSHPSTTIERCGNESNWTPDLFNILPLDDANPFVDIYCGLVSGSYDPNDKQGYPLGIGNAHEIQPQQALEYLIRFQNTGTDTAFTVVVRDTLSTDLDIYSILSGVASHDYSFKIYGPRVLEWTFNHIMLPDSNTNAAASHGFVRFKVNQAEHLPLGTLIENTAQIYFDFNAPIVTNTTEHHLALPQDLNWDGQQTLDLVGCDRVLFNSIVYDQAGTYWQAVRHGNIDSLYSLNITLHNNAVNRSDTVCSSYIAADGQIYTASGQYTAIIPNYRACDSLITIDLIVQNTSSTVSLSSCSPYIAPDNQSYTTSGLYTAIIPNAIGCDSIITINLNILPVETSISIFSNVLYSFANNANFQWLDCTNNYAPIPGATGPVFSPLVNGIYALQVHQNGCVDTSSCYTIVITDVADLQQEDKNWVIYPNPVKELLFIRSKSKFAQTIDVQVVNHLGQTVLVKQSNQSITEIDLSTLPAGMYYLSIHNNGQRNTYKVVKD
ncbi:MAG: Unknown protein [uncultured Aureispira sp.]|uniref:Uncharacterized protein n=1 Tax=uncultured Aureispira sp. TaxID=1331704 RepID=A0A6S6SEB3_9BACT|nr:MAG: Unknown protein [uncultured Aureispira sp.]